MQIRMVLVDALRQDPKNARVHPERNQVAIRESLRRFGQRRPIVVRDGIVIAGNGVLQQAIRLGWEEVGVVDADDLTAEEATAFALVDNQTGDLSHFDTRVVEDTLAELSRTLPQFDPSLFALEDKTPNAPKTWDIEIRQPPTMAWVLVGIPTNQYHRIAADVDSLRANGHVEVLEVVLNAENTESQSRSQTAPAPDVSAEVPR